MKTLVPLQSWLREQAERERITQNALENRIARGQFPAPKKVRKNKRVVFVEVES
jgi:hypothetical protein